MSEMEEKRYAQQHDLDDIRDTVHKIETTKQDRIKVGAWVSLFALLGINALVLAFSAGMVVSRLNSLEAQFEVGTQDRYRGTQAQQDFKLRDQKMDFLQEQIDAIKNSHDTHALKPCHDGACIELERFKAHDKEAELWKERILLNGGKK